MVILPPRRDRRACRSRRGSGDAFATPNRPGYTDRTPIKTYDAIDAKTEKKQAVMMTRRGDHRLRREEGLRPPRGLCGNLQPALGDLRRGGLGGTKKA